MAKISVSELYRINRLQNSIKKLAPDVIHIERDYIHLRADKFFETFKIFSAHKSMRNTDYIEISAIFNRHVYICIVHLSEYFKGGEQV
jgi:hypothetical protein